jgi:hypothetical protein
VANREQGGDREKRKPKAVKPKSPMQISPFALTPIMSSKSNVSRRGCSAISHCQAALASLAALTLAHPVAVAQELRRDIGVLTCDLAKSGGVRSGSEATPQRQTRHMLCAFRPSISGPEETYTGTMQSLMEDQQLSNGHMMMWIVKGAFATTEAAGLLQQIYVADPAAPPGHAPALIGESNSSIVLQPMADSQAPRAADKQQPAAGALVVLVALKLRSTPT